MQNFNNNNHRDSVNSEQFCLENNDLEEQKVHESRSYEIPNFRASRYLCVSQEQSFKGFNINYTINTSNYENTFVQGEADNNLRAKFNLEELSGWSLSR